MFNILVIDDDKNVRYLMREVLEHAGYNVYSAENGEKAFDLMENIHIDLVIVDIMMPVINGYEFTSSIRKFNKELPILMVSAKQSIEDRKKGFKLGIDDYMSKPIDNEELLLHIKALLRRSNMLSEKKLHIGNVILDYDSLTVSRLDESYELPQKEFYLLFKLLSYPNKIFTRIQLMDEIWGLDCETSSDTLSVHILRLRKKFEHWDEFKIESIRGLGYKAVKNV
jgi:DNA-binding response OmpR family regulator